VRIAAFRRWLVPDPGPAWDCGFVGQFELRHPQLRPLPKQVQTHCGDIARLRILLSKKLGEVKILVEFERLRDV
jgi:hypothetical protein